MKLPLRALAQTIILVGLLRLAVPILHAQSQPSFVYTNNNNNGPNTVSTFSVASNGSLSPIAGSPFATGGMGTGCQSSGCFDSVRRIAVSKTGNFLFASNEQSGDISVFSINPNTGSLALVPGSPFTGATNAPAEISLALSPDGRFLMAGNVEAANIIVFNIASNGALSQVSGSPFPASGGPLGPLAMSVSPDGAFLFAALNGPIAVFDIGPDGTLRPVSGSPFPGSSTDVGLDISCSGDRLFAAGNSRDLIDVFSVASGGTLSSIAGSPFQNTNQSSGVIELNPNNQLLYSSNFSGVTAFAVASDGTLGMIAGSPFAVGGIPFGIAFDKLGEFVFTTNMSSIGAFSVGTNGIPSPVPGSPFAAQGNGFVMSLVTFPAPSCPLVEGQPGVVYANNNSASANSVSAFSVVAADGSLAPISGSPFATGGTGGGPSEFAANRILVSAGNKFLFATNDGSSNISVFSIDGTTGILSPVSGSPFATGGTGGSGISLAVVPDGKFLIAGNQGSNNITVFNIATDGGLLQVAGSPFAVPGSPAGMAVSPDGAFLFVGLSGPIAVFGISTKGQLTQIPGSPFQGAGADAGLDISCAGDHLFAGGVTTGASIIDVFSVADSGMLTPIAGSPFQGGGLDSAVVLLDPTNQFLFVSNSIHDPGTLTVFTVSPNGSLALVLGSPFSAGALPAGMAFHNSGKLLFTADLTSIGVFTVASNGIPTPVGGSPFTLPGVLDLINVAAFPPARCQAIPGVNLSSQKLVFPSQTLGTTSAPMSIALTNTGGAPLLINSITTTGTNSADFLPTNNCSGSVPAGALCQIDVAFAPSGVKVESASLIIADNTNGSTQSVSLTGTGASFSFATQANGGSTSATVTAGQTAAYNLQLIAVNGFTGAVNLSCTGAPAGAVCTPTPSTVNLSANSVPFTVMVTTTARPVGSISPAPPSELVGPKRWPWIVISLPILLLVVALRVRASVPRPSRRLVPVVWPTVALLLLSVCHGCSGGGGGGQATSPPSGPGGGTPAGTSQLLLTGAPQQGTSQSTQLTLVVQ